MKSSCSFLKCFSLVAALVLSVAFCAQAAVDPVTVEVHYQSGVKYFKRGLYDKSIQEFEKTLSLDPAHAEAKAYLDKVREFEKQQKPAEPEVSRDAEVRHLYDQGRALYRKGDYENAKDIFNKILEIKRVDDFASYYREQCEIYISRKIARDKKIAEKAAAKEKAEQERQKKKEAAQEKRIERQDVLSKRAAIKEEQRQTSGKVSSEVDQAVTVSATEKPLTPAEIKKQEKQRQAQEKQQAALERRKAMEKERQEKIQAKAERQERERQEKASAREAKKIEKEQAATKRSVKKETEAEEREDRQAGKELFIKGVEQYGKKNYQEAIATFDALIEKEKQSGMIYTRTAQRLKDKAELRLKGVGEDKEL